MAPTPRQGCDPRLRCPPLFSRLPGRRALPQRGLAAYHKGLYRHLLHSRHEAQLCAPAPAPPAATIRPRMQARTAVPGRIVGAHQPRA
jgi:hypothetical protein